MIEAWDCGSFEACRELGFLLDETIFLSFFNICLFRPFPRLLQGLLYYFAVLRDNCHSSLFYTPILTQTWSWQLKRSKICPELAYVERPR
jgi:hypothetical protein